MSGGMKVLLLAAMCGAALAPRAQAADLIFASAEGKPKGEAYAGLGWMSLPDVKAGAVLSFEMGASQDGARMAVQGGWRLSMGRMIATVLGGVEQSGLTVGAVGSADLWWDKGGWMATARMQSGTDYTSWRTAFGNRLAGEGPFVGPELSSTGEGVRLGMHATGLHVFGGIEARASAGTSLRGDYAELSLWRSF